MRRRMFARSAVDYHVFLNGVEFVHRGRKSRTVVFDGMTAVIPKGRRLAIMGARRSGKSTLVKLIAGVAVPSAGQVVRRSRISWPVGGGYFFSPMLTVRDNVIFCANLLGTSPRTLLSLLDELCALGPRREEVLGNLPRIYRQRLAVALPLVMDFDCFLIDDQIPMAAAQFPADRMDFLRRELFRKDLIVVTGRRNVALDMCNTGAVIRDGHIEYRKSLRQAIDEVGARDGAAGEERADGPGEETAGIESHGAW